MKLNYKKVFYVGLAFFLISLFWQTYDSVISKILIDKFGLNQTWSGVVMAIDNVLALILIPLFGSLSDKTSTKLGKRTPYVIVGTVIAAFAFVGLTFSDNYQTNKLETETSIVADYNDIQGRSLSYSEWVTMRNSIEDQWAELLDEGRISQSAYDNFYLKVIDGDDADDTNNVNDYDYESDRREGMEEILLASNGVLTDKDNADLKEYFYLHLNQKAWVETSTSPGTFIIFSVTLFIALLSMATFRSPAVALMPDVTIKPLRSKANAVINLMGTFGGIGAIVILTIFSLDNLSYVNYAPAFITVGVIMLILLGVFLWKVKEPKLVEEKEAEDIKYGLENEDLEAALEHESVEELSKEKKKALILILASVFLWFIGYNAVTTKLSDYAPKVLEMGFSLPLLIAQGAALIAFVPIGIIATKIGRRKTILIGIVLLTLCFGSVYFLTPDTAFIMYAIFGLTGIGWATINVNSYPMVVELAKGSNVGKYTGYYYTFSMAAQILTPIISGMLMDSLGRKALFPYAAIFVGLAFITMFFVKHGDAKVIKKDSVIENFDVDMD
ncbi:MAG: MFS transporter [Candidatus Izemoplasmatales bacterium]|jgi:MFS family permease|nr:MFS transporter [Candidatus Izemoplasmatales bacterium]